MTLKEELNSWLNRDDKLQCKWFLQRLTGERNIDIDAPNYDRCVQLLTSDSNNSDQNMTIEKIRRSWSSYKGKYRDGVISCSFVIDIEAYNELTSLAKKLKVTKNKAIELIIHKQYSKEVNAKIRREKREAEQKRENNINLDNFFRPLEYKKKMKEATELKEENTKLIQDRNKLIYNISQLTVLLNNEDVLSTDLTEEQKKTAKKMYLLLLEKET